MVPSNTSALSIVGSQVTGWLSFAVLLLVPGVVATVFCIPVLFVPRIRSLFRRLPPFESSVPTFVLLGLAGSFPYALGLVAALAMPETGKMLFTVTLAVSVCYVVGIPVVAVGLSEAGIDWDPTGYGVSTWAILLVAGTWYVALLALPLTAISAVFSLPGG